MRGLLKGVALVAVLGSALALAQADPVGQAQQSQADITLFIGNGAEWLNSTWGYIKKFQVHEAIKLLSWTLLLLGSMITLLRQGLGGQFGKMVRTAFLMVIAGFFLGSCFNAGGFNITKLMQDSWVDAYEFGNRQLTNTLIKEKVIQTHQSLMKIVLGGMATSSSTATNMANFFGVDLTKEINNAVDLSVSDDVRKNRINQKYEMLKTQITDPAERMKVATQLYEEEMKATDKQALTIKDKMVKVVTEKIVEPIDHTGWVYILLVPFLEVYAGSVYLLGMVTLLAMLAMPLFAALMPLMGFDKLINALQAWLVSVLAVMILPVIFGVAIDVAYVQPTNVLASELQKHNTGAGFSWGVWLAYVVAAISIAMGIGIGYVFMKTAPSMIGSALGGISLGGSPAQGRTLQRAAGAVVSMARTMATKGRGGAVVNNMSSSSSSTTVQQHAHIHLPQGWQGGNNNSQGQLGNGGNNRVIDAPK